ncbi:MAG: hypothetical protein AAGA65_11755 [Actinomycetota bacterium]
MNQQPEDSESSEEPQQPVAQAGVPLAGQAMVGCQVSLEDLFRYMDGHLDEQRQQEVREKLSSCSETAKYYHFQASFRHLIGKGCKSELPADLSQRIFRSLPDQT